MKVAGAFTIFIGLWILLTLFMASVYEGRLPYSASFEEKVFAVAPWALLILVSIVVIGMGLWLLNKETK